MIDREHPLPQKRQAELLQISRSSLYYAPVPFSKADLELMREIDRLHTDYPFAGARMLRDMLNRMGYRVGRRHISRLMNVMGIEALYRRRRGTKTSPDHQKYPLAGDNYPDRSASTILAVREEVAVYGPGIRVRAAYPPFRPPSFLKSS